MLIGEMDLCWAPDPYSPNTVCTMETGHGWPCGWARSSVERFRHEVLMADHGRSEGPMSDTGKKRVPPFDDLPPGWAIASYFWCEVWSTYSPHTHEGIPLWRDGEDYCTAWVEAVVDHDMRCHVLLDVTTSNDDKTTRDYLLVSSGGDEGDASCWQEAPIETSAAPPHLRERSRNGVVWMANTIEVEDEYVAMRPLSATGEADR